MQELCACMLTAAEQAHHSHAGMQNLPNQHWPAWTTAAELTISSDDVMARAEV